MDNVNKEIVPTNEMYQTYPIIYILLITPSSASDSYRSKMCSLLNINIDDVPCKQVNSFPRPTSLEAHHSSSVPFLLSPSDERFINEIEDTMLLIKKEIEKLGNCARKVSTMHLQTLTETINEIYNVKKGLS